MMEDVCKGLVEDTEKMVTRMNYDGNFSMIFYQNVFPEDEVGEVITEPDG